MLRPSMIAAFAATTLSLGTLAACGGKAPDAAKSAPPAAAPAQADNAYAPLAKLPDWNGVWEPALFARPGGDRPARRLRRRSSPKSTPHNTRRSRRRTSSTPGINFVSQVANCVPPGLPGSMTQPYPSSSCSRPGA